jgi:hypothetical protein
MSDRLFDRSLDPGSHEPESPANPGRFYLHHTFVSSTTRAAASLDHKSRLTFMDMKLIARSKFLSILINKSTFLPPFFFLYATPTYIIGNHFDIIRDTLITSDQRNNIFSCIHKETFPIPIWISRVTPVLSNTRDITCGNMRIQLKAITINGYNRTFIVSRLGLNTSNEYCQNPIPGNYLGTPYLSTWLP